MLRIFSGRLIFPFLFIALCCVPLVAQAQSPVEFILYVDVDTITVYIPGNQIISLQGFGFAVTVNEQTSLYTLASYPAFGIPFDRLPTPICFRLERDGTSRALPLECQGKTTLIQRLPDADVFWYDLAANQERVFQVVQGITPLGFCGAGQSQCNLVYTPPEPTPLPPTLEPPTQDPVNAALTQIVQSWTPTPPPDLTMTAQQAMVYAGGTLTALAPTPTPVPLGYSSANPVTTNSQWTPVIQADPFGVEMVLVPAGSFMMGSTEAEFEAAFALCQQQSGNQCTHDSFALESPQTTITFDKPFWIDRYEVTNAQFNALGGAAARPSNWTDDQRPRENITWFEARDFCEQKREGRLPTEAEWEYAARGPDRLIYPWGNDFVPDNAVFSGNSNNQTAPVGSRLGGASWVGALDMIGNVDEQLSSLFIGYPYDANHEGGGDPADGRARILRGGDWGYIRYAELRAANRSFQYPLDSNPDWYKYFGVRCVRDF